MRDNLLEGDCIMIAEVKFDQIMPRKTYNELSSMFDFGETTERIVEGWNGLQIATGYYYKDEVVESVDADDKTTYHLKEDLTKEIDSYYVKPRLSEDYIGIVDESKTRQVVNLDEIYAKNPNIKLTIIKVIPINVGSIEQVFGAITELSRKIDYVSTKQFDFNAKCNVHVPNLGLLKIKTVDYVCDMCTEELQRKLDAGWRIVACCPQPNQRRPDYILGKMEIDEDD